MTAVRQKWVQDVDDLVQQVAAWARQESGWKINSLTKKSIAEEGLGEYEAALVTLQTPDGSLILEPIARNFPGRGIVELYAWPTLFRVRLLRGEADTDWHIRVDSGFTLHQDWNRENFITLANDLLNAS